tara:strand:- start:242 stop:1045 length:804 start_codon:yes stop_codon:yes gene_type:complete
MKILITGASGFLGSEVVNILSNKKYKILKISRSKKNFFNCDLENTQEVSNLLSKANPDVIINLAAKVDFKKKINSLKINYKLPKLLSNYCKKNKKYLIHSSSISIHGDKEKYSIKSRNYPNSPYAISKLMGDKNIINSKCNYTIIRFPGIYGANGPNHMFINKLMKRGVAKKIHIDNNGNQLRNYLFVKDAAKIIFSCLKKKSKNIIYVGGERISIKNILLLMKKNKFIKDLSFGKDLKKNQILKSNIKFKYTTFIKNIRLIKNQLK